MDANDVAGLFEQILDCGAVASDDNFFELGGNSLLALTLIGRLKERSCVRISLTDVVRDPTPRGIAGRLTQVGQSD
ncbi:phosphopantetheine-binding protein [Streptomyces sp. NPDC047042]|uniref:phosphopantetheine-binding protein n=1 Tax=Streptomyces sp. NPDC047042 TaxID=3154807 RepID=UPI0034055D7D